MKPLYLEAFEANYKTKSRTIKMYEESETHFATSHAREPTVQQQCQSTCSLAETKCAALAGSKRFFFYNYT